MNTASIAGLMTGHHREPYITTKHEVVAPTEQLAVEFDRMKARISALALFLSWVVHLDQRIRAQWVDQPSQQETG